MLFRQLFDRTSCNYTYLLADEASHDAVIIDPVRENVEQYLKLLDELKLELKIAIDTHTHADHITASGVLRQRTDCKVVASKQSQAQSIDQRFDDGDDVHCGSITLHALYTPGHTDDTYCFLVDGCLFTGDTLFIRGTGRTDLQHGDSFKQFSAITQKLLTLPDSTKVYPGHDYNGMTVSTIGEERRFNPRLQVNSAEEYAEIMANLNLDPPKLIDVAVPANLKCGLE